jgi:hypothetical protein
MTRGLLAFALVLAPLAAGASPAGSRYGVLAVDAPAALEPTVRGALARALSRRGVSLLGVAELQAALARASRVRELGESARRSLVRAELALAQMDRGTALLAAREAIATLGRIAGRWHAGGQLVLAQLAVARAHLLAPADPAGVEAALAAALEVEPELRADLRSMPPRIAASLEELRRRPRARPVPSAAELAAIAELAGLDGVIWAAARPAGERVSLALHLGSPRPHPALRREATVERTRIAAEVEDLVGAMRRFPPVAAIVAPVPPPATAPPRWYRRWWVWTIAGAALAGAGVTLGVVLGRARSYDVTVAY